MSGRSAWSAAVFGCLASTGGLPDGGRGGVGPEALLGGAAKGISLCNHRGDNG